MTDRYVGPGGDNANSGLTWALRKETLNGVEDTPVVAGDTIYVGPGTYRENLTCDVDGSDGSPITYIGDPLGIYTDGVGGEVRITGSDDDKTETRTSCVVATGKGYRTFIGLRMDMATTYGILGGAGTNNLVVEDCSIASGTGIYFNVSASNPGLTVKRCLFVGGDRGIHLIPDTNPVDCLIQNCIFYYQELHAIYLDNAWNTTINNCSIIDSQRATSTGIQAGIYVDSNSNAVYVYNSVIFFCALEAATPGDIVEDYCYYNPLLTDATSRVNVTKGANSVTRNYIMTQPLLLDGFYMPTQTLDFAAYSPIKNYGCGQSPPSVDFYGLTRPTTDSKKTRGAIQFNQVEREATTVPSGESESVKMSDACTYQIFVPTTGNKMRFVVQAYREGDYAGTAPQLIIKQPGQSEITITDTGATGQWNELGYTYTPASSPAYIVLEIRSNNTATSGNYEVYWGAFEVK